MPRSRFAPTIWKRTQPSRRRPSPSLIFGSTRPCRKTCPQRWWTLSARRNADSAPWQSINVGDLLPTQTTVQTGDNSAVLLQLPDRHIFRIGAGSTVLLKQLGKDKEFSFSVLSGHVWSFVRRAEKPAKYEIETSSAVIGVSGTVFSVSHDPASADTEVSTDKGEVKVSAGSAAQTVSTGYTLRAHRGSTPHLAHASLSRNLARRRRKWPARPSCRTDLCSVPA